MPQRFTRKRAKNGALAALKKMARKWLLKCQNLVNHEIITCTNGIKVSINIEWCKTKIFFKIYKNFDRFISGSISVTIFTFALESLICSRFLKQLLQDLMVNNNLKQMTKFKVCPNTLYWRVLNTVNIELLY